MKNKTATKATYSQTLVTAATYKDSFNELDASLGPNDAFVAIKKLKGKNILLTAARHNKREILAELTSGRIKPAKSQLNEVLWGPDSATEVAEQAEVKMLAAGIKSLRHDAVRGLELVFSLPPGINLNVKRYFSDCVDWASTWYGGYQNILSVDLHLDESAPHCHLLILPLAGGHMNGSAMVGNKNHILKVRACFNASVAAPHGLALPQKLSIEARRALAAAVYEKVRIHGDPVASSALWQCVRPFIEAHPRRFAAALGLATEPPAPKKVKSFTDIMISKGKRTTEDRSRLR